MTFWMISGDLKIQLRKIL